VTCRLGRLLLAGYLTAACVPVAAAAQPDGGAAPAREERLRAPGGRVEVVVRAGARLAYDVLLDGKALLEGSTLALEVDHVALGVAPVVTAVRRRTVDGRIEPPVRQTAAVLLERYNELRLECAGGYAVVFRAYDQGVAYRFETALPRPDVKITGEEARFVFAGPTAAAAAGLAAYYPQEESFFSHNEREFRRLRLGEIASGTLASIPAVVETAAGPKVAIAESDLDDYPGLWLRGTGGPALAAAFPPYPLEEKLFGDRDLRVVRAADYLAVTRGTRSFPWRVLAIAPRDADLVASTLVYLLARPSQIADTSWIRPGKVAWDWWNASHLHGVSFKTGVNTATYEYFVDFAAKYGIEYIILDEGWYRRGNLLEVVPELDMPALLAYAKRKNVGVILWTVWKTLADQLDPALAQFEKWGVKGLKVDFMQRDDQPTMAFYERICRELARRKMLVDFHGALRPALMTRTWPNLITTEGVRGLEHLKWSNASDPEHNLMLPFTRMLVGPMDYTPGAMLNADRTHFKVVFREPMSLGTRAHQLAMYVVFESPLQMLADSPSHYLAEPVSMEFLAAVPTVWDETRVLDGRIGDYVVVARRSGSTWFLGAMSDWTPRELELDLGFLGAGPPRELVAYEDGPRAPEIGTDLRRTTQRVDASTRLKVKLASGGGWVARIQP
jgi:alpha-glucosidase